MKKKGIVCLVLFCILQLIKLWGVNLMTKEYGQGRIEAYFNSPRAYASFILQEGYERLSPAVLGKQQCTVKVKKERQVRVIATNWRLAQIEPIHMDNGAFFGKEGTYEGRNVAVISDTLAIELFGSKKATGNTCLIDDVYYQIVGVYKHYHSFKDRLCDKGQEVVYLPITSSIGKKSQIEAVLLTTQVDGTAIEAKDLTTLGLSSAEATIYYGSNVTKRLKKAFYIAEGFLPPYNIFDINYYLSVIKKQLIIHNQLQVYALTDFEALFWWLRKWILRVNVLQFLICFELSRCLYNFFARTY